MKFWRAKQLTLRKFKRLTGISRRTFQEMVGLVKADEKKKKKSGRRPKLIIEDQVLMVIQYWREYRTYYHIGLDWGQYRSVKEFSRQEWTRGQGDKETWGKNEVYKSYGCFPLSPQLLVPKSCPRAKKSLNRTVLRLGAVRISSLPNSL